MSNQNDCGDKKVRVRAAPSPTGRVHTGNLRTFLNNYLWAKHCGGTNVLRIEDTDQKRKVEGGIESIVETLKLYGIEFDEGPLQGGEYGPYIQTKRLDLYQKHAHELVEKGKAYYCFCSEERLEKLREEQIKNKQKPMYDRKCRDIDPEEAKSRIEDEESYVVRMKFPLKGHMEFEDEISGKIRVNNKEIDDMILLKSDGLPTYHFGVVIDDHYMEITYVFRGREYLTQTTRNIFLYDSFGWDPPKWVHTPHLLNPDGKGKLSKRKGSMPAVAYLRKGYLVDAVLNYLVLCGWAPAPEDAREDEVYTHEDLIDLFHIKRMKKSNARYDQDKLDHFNGEHIRIKSIEELSDTVFHWAEEYVLGEFTADKFDEHPDWEEELVRKVEKYLPLWKKDEEYFLETLKLVRERIVCLSELPDLLDFFYDVNVDVNEDAWDVSGHSRKETADALMELFKKLRYAWQNDKHWGHDMWEDIIRNYADEIDWKHGEMFMTLRVAVTGRKASPPLFECMEVLGLERCEKLVNNSYNLLKE